MANLGPKWNEGISIIIIIVVVVVGVGSVTGGHGCPTTNNETTTGNITAVPFAAGVCAGKM